MKNTKLHIFLAVLDQADAFLKVHDRVYYLISLNDIFSVTKYKQILDDMSKQAFFDHLSNLLPSNGDSSDYREALIHQLEESLSLIECKEGIYTHKRLKIRDTDDKSYFYDEIPEKLKRELSGYIEVQRNAILSFIDKIKNKEDGKTKDKVMYDKPTNNKEKIANIVSETLPQYPDEKLAQGDSWLDGEDVCRMLKITKRTLQSYRDKGILPFSQIGYKYFYKDSDIRNILNKNYNTPN